jgi:hypothetical protein
VMRVSVEVSFDEAALRRLTRSPGSPLVREVHRRVQRVEARAKQLAPVDSGNLRRNIRVRGPAATASGVGWDVVAAVAYALWIHRGRREYKRGTGRFVYASAGPRPFLLRALLEVFG